MCKSYYISPVPDVYQYVVDIRRDKFLILATDGLWNAVRPQEAINFVYSFREDESARGERRETSRVAQTLITEALRRWNMKAPWSADNIRIMVVFFGEEKENYCKKQSTEGKSLKKKLATKAHFTKRVTIMPKDIQLSRRICCRGF